MKIKRLLAALIAALTAVSVTACTVDEGGTGGSGSGGTHSSGAAGNSAPDITMGSFSDYDLDDSYDYESAVKIEFSDSGAVTTGSGASASGGKVTISAPGTYVISGTSSDGRIVVNVTKNDKVQLVLNGVDLTSKDSAAIHIMSADKVKITLADGTVNRMTDASSYAEFVNDNEPTGCVFSKDDLTINGSGTLYVTGNYNNGIASKNDIRILGGIINVVAKNHGIKGKDSVVIADGIISVNAGSDGIKSDNELEKGYISVIGGTIDIKAGDDALQAFSSIVVTAGKITASAEDKITNCDGNIDIVSGCLTVVAE